MVVENLAGCCKSKRGLSGKLNWRASECLHQLWRSLLLFFHRSRPSFVLDCHSKAARRRLGVATNRTQSRAAQSRAEQLGSDQGAHRQRQGAEEGSGATEAHSLTPHSRLRGHTNRVKQAARARSLSSRLRAEQAGGGSHSCCLLPVLSRRCCCCCWCPFVASRSESHIRLMRVGVQFSASPCSRLSVYRCSWRRCAATTRAASGGGKEGEGAGRPADAAPPAAAAAVCAVA